MHLKRTNSSDTDFIKLVVELDKDLAKRDGDEHSFYAQFNKIDNLKYVVVAYQDNVAISCAAIKEYAADTVEVKRMFTLPEYRGKGIAVNILTDLEKWAIELGYSKCILETGLKQQEAIRLYRKSNYSVIKNYGQYEGVLNSICFEKQLSGT